MRQPSWRAKFIELCEGIFRELGFPPPAMLHEDSLPLAMELEVEQLPFELLHTPNGLGHRALVACRLGLVPAGAELSGMKAMLKSNLTLMRAHEAAFGMSPDNGEVRCIYYEDLQSASSVTVLDRMRRIAPDARDWAQGFFAHASNPACGTPEVPAFTLA